MNYAENILQTIGNTPLVRLNKITNEIDALVLAKVESFNPGNSTKDRMAVKMVEDAEADGRLQPSWTIVEGTSGNTGMGLALAAIVKGYKLICVSTDKQSKEKFDVLLDYETKSSYNIRVVSIIISFKNFGPTKHITHIDNLDIPLIDNEVEFLQPRSFTLY